MQRLGGSRDVGYSVAECLQMEFAVGRSLLLSGGADLVEGARAASGDGDARPRWQHAAVEDVPDALVASLLDGDAAGCADEADLRLGLPVERGDAVGPIFGGACLAMDLALAEAFDDPTQAELARQQMEAALEHSPLRERTPTSVRAQRRLAAEHEAAQRASVRGFEEQASRARADAGANEAAAGGSPEGLEDELREWMKRNIPDDDDWDEAEFASER
jgi:hypothetical protein